MSKRGFYLPAGLGMKIENIDVVANQLKKIMQKYN